MAIKVVRSPPQRKSRSLFHYTTAQGLLGIIRDRALFATHADFSNDSTECKIIRPLLIKLLTSDYERLFPKLSELNALDSDFFREYGRAGYKEAAKDSVSAMLEAANATAPFFITSFCIHDEKDDEYSHGLLSQWRSYALGGFAIEFDEFGLDTLSDDEFAAWKYQGIIREAVVYKDHEARVKPKDFEGMAGAFLRTILRVERPNLEEILGGAAVNDFARPFLSVAPFLKHRL